MKIFFKKSNKTMCRTEISKIEKVFLENQPTGRAIVSFRFHIGNESGATICDATKMYC